MDSFDLIVDLWQNICECRFFWVKHLNVLRDKVRVSLLLRTRLGLKLGLV